MGKKNEPIKDYLFISTKSEGYSQDLRQLGVRIAELRASKDLSAEVFGGRLGVTKPTQLAYEKGTRAPDAGYLYQAKEVFRADVGYLVSGVSTVKIANLTQAESETIARYRELPSSIRRTVDDVLLLAWLAYKDRKDYHAA